MHAGEQRYQIQKQLGRGGTGAVYHAVDRLTGQEVALKRIEVDGVEVELNPALASPDYQQLTLAREFRLLAALRHPNIVSVLDYGFAEGRTPFFIMELIPESRSLHEAARTLDVRGKVDLLIQILQAIAYLHRHDILHRDLKPGNILATPENVIKVLDFGIALKQGERQDISGTLSYMAPEVLEGDTFTEAADLWAVGVVAYELLSGSLPFTGERFADISMKIMTAKLNLIPFYRHADPLMERLALVIGRLLEKDPEERYPDAISVIRALCETMGDPLPPEEGVIRESFLQAAKFVGRDEELSTLRIALKDAKNNSLGSVWLIGGESGVGKSRLMDEMRIHAMVGGAMIARGQAVEGKSASVTLWAGVLRPLLLSVPVSDAEASLLKEVIPDIATILGREVATHPAPTLPDFMDAAAAVISRVQQPLFMMLEDLQWAGGDLEPLQKLLPIMDELPVMILATYRMEEAPQLHEDLPGANVLKLERLGEAQIAELSASMLGAAGRNPKVVDLLCRETEGNAFFMVEVVRALAEEAGQLDEVGHFELPEEVLTGGIARLIQRRLRMVPDWAFGGLQVAALLGRTLDLRILDQVLSPILSLMTGQDLSVSVSSAWREQRGLRLEDWLLVCADAAIIEAQGDEWRFTHDKLREQLLADLDEQQKSMLQKQIARYR